MVRSLPNRSRLVKNQENPCLERNFFPHIFFLLCLFFCEIVSSRNPDTGPASKMALVFRDFFESLIFLFSVKRTFPRTFTEYFSHFPYVCVSPYTCSLAVYKFVQLLMVLNNNAQKISLYAQCFFMRLVGLESIFLF